MQIPFLRYFTFVGGFLLSILLIVNAYLPADRVDDNGNPTSKPTILIESSRKWPERIVYDTNLPTTLAAVPPEAPAVVSSVPRSPLDSMALAAPTPPKPAVAPQVARKKRAKIARVVSQPRFAYLQQQRRPPNYFAPWW